MKVSFYNIFIHMYVDFDLIGLFNILTNNTTVHCATKTLKQQTKNKNITIFKILTQVAKYKPRKSTNFTVNNRNLSSSFIIYLPTSFKFLLLPPVLSTLDSDDPAV